MNAAQQAALMLSAVNLPGGVQVSHFLPLEMCLQPSSLSSTLGHVQRRRNAEDELNMRFVYDEGDLIGVSKGKLVYLA